MTSSCLTYRFLCIRNPQNRCHDLVEWSVRIDFVARPSP
jgi:hypothetical protein